MVLPIDRNEFCQESPETSEHELDVPQTAFPAQIDLNGQQYNFAIWAGEQLPDRLIAYDTETALIEGGEIPQLALSCVYGDQGSAYLIHPARLPQFIKQHPAAYYVCHNAVFDFWATAQHLKSDPTALTDWWDVAGDGRLCCTMILDVLIRLARIDEEPRWRDLGTVAKEYCGVELDKDDPYRLRYGELIGLSGTSWESVDPGFWRYAAKDPVATLQVCQRQFQISHELIQPRRSQLLPGAIRRFGPLTACLQVQGAIALDYISRHGISVDVIAARKLQATIADLVRKHMADLELLGGNKIFHRYGPRSKKAGQLQMSKSGVPRRNAKLIKQRLELIAKSAEEPVRPRRNKDGLVTDSVKYWKQHQELDPFVRTFVQFSEQAKLVQFFAKMDQDRIYPKYHPLKRTGRTSCSDPNLQQLPRDGRFREMIQAPPGYWLLQIDYSAIELRTLAQVCLKRYGRSVLADLFRQGSDPHRYTAALLLGLSPKQFERLPADEQKRFRQRAKAVNFGVPGGLGAKSLVAYAKQSYGVKLTMDEAKEFRRRLITQIYPELDAYLRDQPLADLGNNLQCGETAARRAFTYKQIRDACRIISGESSTPGGDEYEEGLIDHVWLTLQQLNCSADLQASLEAKQPSLELARRVFWGHALSLSGRLRGHVGFSQRANTPFQALAADGNKLAIFRLLRAGYQVCGFIHDEALVLIPDGADYARSVARIEQILVNSMREFTPDIPISTEHLLADRWYKDAAEQPLGTSGQIIPYTKDPTDHVTVEQQQPGTCAFSVGKT
jgi:hypothetical protein